MKFRIFSLMAVAAGMLLGSCVKETQMSGGAEDSALVSFELNLEDAARTRADGNSPEISDGSKVNKLIYSVYDEEGNLLSVTDDPATPDVTEQGVYEGSLLGANVKINCRQIRNIGGRLYRWCSL